MSETKSDSGRSTKNSRKAAAVDEQNKLLQEVLKASREGDKVPSQKGQNQGNQSSTTGDVPSLGGSDNVDPVAPLEKAQEKRGVKQKANSEADVAPDKKVINGERGRKQHPPYRNDFYNEEDLFLQYPGYEQNRDLMGEFSGSNRFYGRDVEPARAGNQRQRSDVSRSHVPATTSRPTREHELSGEEEEDIELEDQYLSGNEENDDFLGDGQWDNNSLSSSAIFPMGGGNRSGRNVSATQTGGYDTGSRPSQPEQNNGGITKQQVGNIIESLVKERVGQEEAKDAVGPAVADCIAELLKVFLKEPNAEAVLKLLENYPRPENVEWLQAPTLGPQVAASIPKKSNSYDKRLKQTQSCLGGGIAAMVGVLQDIMNRGKNDASLLPLARKVMDALTLTGYVHFDINAIRKGAIRQVVNPQYAGVFTKRTTPTPESLLGENSVPDQLKEYEEIGKVRAKLQKPKRGFGHDSRSDGQRGRGRGFGSPQYRGSYPRRGSSGGHNTGYNNNPHHFQQRGGRGVPPGLSTTEESVRAPASEPASVRCEWQQGPQEHVNRPAVSLKIFPIGGNIMNHKSAWLNLTSDPWVHEVVNGLKLEFWTVPIQDREPRPFNLSMIQVGVFDKVVQELLMKGVIELSEEEQGQFISNIFVRPKPNGKVRLILDLTELNKFLILQHFKLDNLEIALHMVQKGCLMGTIDLQDAYFAVGVHNDFKKFLKFRWLGRLWQFRAVPMGLACAPYVFTKLLRPIFTSFREKGKQCFCYLDDVFIAENSVEKCRDTTLAVKDILESLGFKIQTEKSQMSPTNVVKFLGFVIDSVQMKVYLPPDKVQKMEDLCKEVLRRDRSSIFQVASVVGLMNSYAKAIDYGENHFKKLEIEKIRALKISKGSYTEEVAVSKEGRKDLIWWKENAKEGVRVIGTKTPQVTLTTDASNKGWGAVLGKDIAQGLWTEKEAEWHINEKELLVVLFGLKSLGRTLKNLTIRLLSDNTTTVTYLNKMGGARSPRCNLIAFLIWSWCEGNELWLLAAHIPGSQNWQADTLSRVFTNNVEWCLNDNIFQLICTRFGTPSVDLFASRVNRKLEKFCSWGPDPEAWCIDAFSFKWENEFFFIFPPFRLVGRVWRKIVDERTHAVLLAPKWPSQVWFTGVTQSARRIIWIKKRKGNLYLPTGAVNMNNFTSTPLIACLF